MGIFDFLRTQKKDESVFSSLKPKNWDMNKLKQPDIFHKLFDPIIKPYVKDMDKSRLYIHWVEGENYGRRACFFVCPTDNQVVAVNQTETYAMTWKSFFLDGQPIEQFICEPLTSNFLQLLQNPTKIPSVPPHLATFFGIFDLTDSETIILLNDLVLYLNYVIVYINKFGETMIWDEIPAKEQVHILKSQINDGKVRKSSKTTDFKSLAGRFILSNPVVPLSIQVLEQQGFKLPTNWMEPYELVKCMQCGVICKKPNFEAGKIYITTNRGKCPNCGKEIE